MRAPTSNSRKFSTPWQAGVLAVFLALIFSVKLFSSLAGWPRTWCDEVWYSEPAVNYINHGVYAAPGLLQQMDQLEIGGFDQHSFLFAPLTAYARIPIYLLFGAEQAGRRIADCIFLALATGALALLLRQWCSVRVVLLSCLLFATHKYVWLDYGRPDLLSLMFGILALSVLMRHLNGRNKTDLHPPLQKNRIGNAFLVGLLIGWSGLSHQVGGVFWGLIIIAAKLTQGERSRGRGSLLQWLVFFGLGGLAGVALWLPQILSAPAVWWSQFSYMLSVKHHLMKSFSGSLVELGNSTIIRNPFVFVLLAAGLLAKRSCWAITDIRMVLIACLGLLGIWRCWAFEPYNPWYSIHFWAAICILFALATGDLIEFLKAPPLTGKKPFVKKAAVVCAMLAVLAGFIPAYNTLVECFMLPFQETRSNAIALLHSHISARDRVLVEPACFFETPSTNKSVWQWADKLDLNDFDVVVTHYPSKESIVVFQDRDSWLDWFTPSQAKIFLDNFELVAGVPPVPLPTNSVAARIDSCFNNLAKHMKIPAAHQGPQLRGFYIYRNKHAAHPAMNKK